MQRHHTIPSLAAAALLAACDEPTRPPAAGGKAPNVQPDVSIAVAPANDDFDAAVVVTALPFTHNVNTSEATTASDDPDDCAGTGPTVWYRFTPTEDVRITANTFGSDYDTDLMVYTGTRGNLTQIACNDDAVDLQSAVTFDAVAGETYFFMVGAFASGSGGNLVFNVDVAPPPLEVDLTIDRVGTLHTSTNTATISGTVTCSRRAFVDVFGVLRDRIGRLIVQEGFSAFVECDGVTTWKWEAQVFPQNVLLVGGPVEVSATACFQDLMTGEFGCLSEETAATVKLRRTRGSAAVVQKVRRSTK